MITMFRVTLYLLCCYTTIQAQIEPERPSFRVIAPQIICAKNNESLVDRPDTTTVMIQTKVGTQMIMLWTVRWLPLRAPSQRFTLLLWRSVRSLEEKFNKEQPDPFIYVIDNKDLLMDVDYVFTVTGISGDSVEQKSFCINNISGKKKLELTEGYVDKLSLVLLGSETTYSNIDYILEAQVTMCNPTQDYQFNWLLHDVDTDVDIHSTIIGSKLMVPSGDLKAGHKYTITCEVIRSSDQMFINQMKFSVQVLRKGLGVSLSSDYLVMSTDNAFIIEAAIFNDDYLSELFNYDWWCKYEEVPCTFFLNINNNTVEISGLPVKGMYEFGISVSNGDYSATASMLVEAVEPRLPILKVTPTRRLVNEGSYMSLVGNATNIAPACSLTWYFSSNLNSTNNDTCEDCQHGEQIADTIIIHSLEENFLNELADFTNETEWRQITAEILAQPGRARLVAECGCSLTFSCDTEGMAYADLSFEVNKSPVIGEVTVSPDSGVALETLFTIRAKDAQDDNAPLTYYFYAVADVNVSVILNSYLGHMAVETVLPYFDGMTTIWVEVCDSLGACSQSKEIIVPVVFGVISPEKLAETALGHLRRCELVELKRLLVTSLLSLKNAAHMDEFTLLSSKLNNVIERNPSEQCLQDGKNLYENVLNSIGH